MEALGSTSSRKLRRARRHGRGRSESGGAISLWVVLMVPVSAFAAVVAMAGPQRMAAESSAQDAADDLAMLAVAWRDGQGAAAGDMQEGPLHAFPPECSTDGQTTHLDGDIEAAQTEIEGYQRQIDPLTPPDPEIDRLQALQDDARQRRDAVQTRKDETLAEWEEACDLLFESLLRDLGYLGVNMNSLRGFYSDSLKMSPETLRPPCRASDAIVVDDAVHVALAADWQHAGWAAAQVWPDGTRVAAESVGRLSRHDTTTAADDCEQALTVLDERGRPVLEPGARELTRSVPRTALSG